VYPTEPLLTIAIYYDSMKSIVTVFLLTVMTTAVGATRCASTYPVDICLRACWPFIPQCTPGWYFENKGTDHKPCYTCCKVPGYELCGDADCATHKDAGTCHNV
jgi:hypothetical protein